MARHKVAEAHIHVHRVAIIDAFLLEGRLLVFYVFEGVVYPLCSYVTN